MNEKDELQLVVFLVTFAFAFLVVAALVYRAMLLKAME